MAYVPLSLSINGIERMKSVFGALDYRRVVGKIEFVVCSGQFLWSHPMDVFRLTVVAFLLVLFSACGGGGGGGGAGSGGGGGGGGITPEPLPLFPIDIVLARQSVGGDAPPILTSEDIGTIRGSRAESANRALADGTAILSTAGPTETRVDLNYTCEGTTCTASVGSNEVAEISLDNSHTPQAAGQDIIGFREEFRAVMTDGGVTLAQGRAAGRSGRGNYQFQTYGGWIQYNFFAVRIDTETTPNGTDRFLTSYSFGDASVGNPESGVTTWNGVMVGATETGQVVHGDAEIGIGGLNSPDPYVDVSFTGIWNFGADASVPNITWDGLPLTDGAFSAENGSIRGVFYGPSHDEVGGVFDRNRIIGSFGAVR